MNFAPVVLFDGEETERDAVPVEEIKPILEPTGTQRSVWQAVRVAGPFGANEVEGKNDGSGGVMERVVGESEDWIEIVLLFDASSERGILSEVEPAGRLNTCLFTLISVGVWMALAKVRLPL